MNNSLYFNHFIEPKIMNNSSYLNHLHSLDVDISPLITMEKAVPM